MEGVCWTQSVSLNNLEIRIIRVSYVALLGAPIALSLDYNFGEQASMMGFVTIPP